MIYLDNAATSFPKPQAVYTAVSMFNRNYAGNPGRGGHRLSRKAAETVYTCRESLSTLFNISNPENIAFTKNATEAINVALKGILKKDDHVVVSPFEHNAVMRPLKQMGVSYSIAKLNDIGNLNAESFMSQIRCNTRLICCTHGSNVSGYICPVAEIGALCKRKRVLFMIDSAQTAGAVPIDVEAMGIDIMAFAGHKGLLGLQGTGGLYLREGIKLSPLIVGGTGSASESLIQPDFMPDVLESGTLNAPGLAGLNQGVKYILQRGAESIGEHERLLACKFMEGLDLSGVKLIGNFSEPMSGVVSLTLDGMDVVNIASQLDKHYDIAARAGLHCAIMAHKTYGTELSGTLRFSFGAFSTKYEANFAASALTEIIKRA